MTASWSGWAARTQPKKRIAAPVIAGLAVAWLGLGGPLAAQSIGLAPEHDLPAWLDRWSVLAPRADLPRHFPTAGSALPAGLFPATTIGLFWTAANPAGLAGAVDSAWTEFRAAAAGSRGAFRRPLDPGGTRLRQISATSWRPLTDRVTMLGRVVLDQERFDPGSQADESEPYPTSPFVTTDSSTSPTRRTRARLEGVAAWRLGAWALGADLGYETNERRTIEAGFARLTRQTMPGVALGVTRTAGGLTVGLVGRYRNRAETIDLTERAAEGQVVDLAGYQGVTPISVNQSYYRRIDEDVPSASLGLSGAGLGGRWVAFVEVSRLRERRTRQQQDQPAYDRWNAGAWTAGAAYQRGLGRSGRWRLTLDGRFTALTGDGDLALDSAGTVFTATERAFEGRAELRRLRSAGGWSGLIAVKSRYENRVRNDSIAVIGSKIQTAGLGVELELGHPLAPGVAFLASGGLVSQASSAAIPAPLVQGAVYQRLIAPELDFYARDLTPWSAGLALRWQASARTALWLAGHAEGVSPRGPMGPTGYTGSAGRSASSVVLGVVLR